MSIPICPQKESLFDNSNEWDMQISLLNQYFNHRNNSNSEAAVSQELQLIQEQNGLLRQIQCKLDSKKSSRFLPTESDDTADTPTNHQSQFFRPAHLPLIITRTNNNILRRTNTRALNNTTTRAQDSESHRRLNTQTSINISRRKTQRKQATASTDDDRTPVEVDGLFEEVASKCSQSALDTLRRLISQANQQTKETSTPQLKEECGALRQQVEEANRKIKSLETQITSLKQSIQRDKRFAATLTERDKALVKKETAFLIKDKLLSEGLSNLKNKESRLLMQESNLLEERTCVNKLWEDVLGKVDVQGSFRTQIFAKCKQSLFNQRKALNDEQLEVDRLHEQLQGIISHIQSVS